jgi:ATP-dependent DNA ligase
MPPLPPMLARPVASVPAADSVPGGLAYEPKWDGFRCIVFRDGDEVELGSRKEKPLTRYFPELVAALLEHLPPRCVVDGEIVVAVDGRLDFVRLLERIHPAASRVAALAERIPASFVAFDLLALDDESWLERPFAQRREGLLDVVPGVAPIHRTPVTHDADTARHWFSWFEGAGLDGLIAKPLTSTYRPGERVMFKVKHARTADVVVAGFRWHKDSTEQEPLLGSLLLGLYAEDDLQFVGVSAAFPRAQRAALADALAPLVSELGEHPWGDWAAPAEGVGRRPGAVSRWNSGKDLQFVPLQPVLVAEVGYDAMEGTRFRHTAQFRHFRPDRDPRSCTFEQLERPVVVPLSEVLSPPAADATADAQG